MAKIFTMIIGYIKRFFCKIFGIKVDITTDTTESDQQKNY